MGKKRRETEDGERQEREGEGRGRMGWEEVKEKYSAFSCGVSYCL